MATSEEVVEEDEGAERAPSQVRPHVAGAEGRGRDGDREEGRLEEGRRGGRAGGGRPRAAPTRGGPARPAGAPSRKGSDRGEAERGCPTHRGGRADRRGRAPGLAAARAGEPAAEEHASAARYRLTRRRSGPAPVRGRVRSPASTRSISARISSSRGAGGELRRDAPGRAAPSASDRQQVQVRAGWTGRRGGRGCGPARRRPKSTGVSGRQMATAGRSTRSTMGSRGCGMAMPLPSDGGAQVLPGQHHLVEEVPVEAGRDREDVRPSARRRPSLSSAAEPAVDPAGAHGLGERRQAPGARARAPRGSRRRPASSAARPTRAARRG